MADTEEQPDYFMELVGEALVARRNAGVFSGLWEAVRIIDGARQDGIEDLDQVRALIIIAAINSAPAAYDSVVIPDVLLNAGFESWGKVIVTTEQDLRAVPGMTTELMAELAEFLKDYRPDLRD